MIVSVHTVFIFQNFRNLPCFDGVWSPRQNLLQIFAGWKISQCAKSFGEVANLLQLHNLGLDRIRTRDTLKRDEKRSGSDWRVEPAVKSYSNGKRVPERLNLDVWC
jgi:hypothetical protein